MAYSLKAITKDCKGMILDGIAASSHIDSSGEILDIEGCDISSVEEGLATCNWEHKSDSPTDTVGRIIYGKKIFSADDCEDERQLFYWKKSGVALIYIVVELMDQDGHKGAADLAGIIRHYSDRKLPILARYSIEGSTLNREGNKLKSSIFKKCAITLTPCNKDATSGLIYDPQAKEVADDSLKSLVGKIDKVEGVSEFAKLGGSVEVEFNPFVDPANPEGSLNKADLKELTQKLQENKARLNARINDLVQTTNGSVWKHKNGHVVVALDPHNRDQWRATYLDKDSQPTGHDVSKTHAGALQFAAEMRADLFGEPAKSLKKNEDIDLIKAMTAGGGMGAPSTLTGGAALSRESVEENSKKKIKKLFKDIFEKWDGDGDFKAFAKAKLPDVSDKFLSTFSDHLDEYKVKLKKQQTLDTFQELSKQFEFFTDLLKQEIPTPFETTFQGKKIRPGYGEVNGGRVAILGSDDTHHFHVPLDKKHSWSDTDIQKTPKDNMFVSQRLVQLEEPHRIGAEHAKIVHPSMAKDIEGLDLNPKNGLNGQFGEEGSNKKAFWTKHKGKTYFVKPDHWPDGDMGEAHREGAFHILGKDFFGIDKHLLPTAHVTNPVTGEHTAIVEHDPEGRHANPDEQQDINALHNLGRDGVLEKLGLVDMITGNADRHGGNYLLNDSGGIKLIDHGLAFDSSHGEPAMYPDYLSQYESIRENQGLKPDEPLNPQTIQWINSLDPEQMAKKMLDLGIPHKYVAESADRLQALKQYANSPNPTRKNAYTSPFHFKLD